MGLENAFRITATALPGSVGEFAKSLKPEWIEEALGFSGTATVRRRRLPGDVVLWLVLGLALLRNQSINRVADVLRLALPSGRRPLAAPSSLAQARQRLGPDALEYLFVVSGSEWATRSAQAHQWKGLSIYAMDGTTLRVPDSSSNWEAFGGHEGNGKRAGSAYPTVRAVALMAARSHLIKDLRIGDYHTGEVTLARQLWPEIPGNSLVLIDRGFLIAAALTGLAGDGTNRHWLTRAKSTTRMRVIEHLGENDDLVEIELSQATRKANPGLPEKWIARAIRYQRKGFSPSTLLTSLLDPVQFPAAEVVAMYHERWEIELAYDEIKTHLLAREETIRSRTPDGVRQELWAIALTYNLVRLEMERAAIAAGVPPTRISFVNSLHLIAFSWTAWSAQTAAPGRIPAQLIDLREKLSLLLLPERRPSRSAPRVVKIKMSNYDKKWVDRPSRK
jgi:hypothetical protein